MPGTSIDHSQDELRAFGHKLGAWAESLDDTQKAMLIDLLAKAGGDVYGNDMADHAASPDDKPTDASDLSPLELDDYTHVIAGIFNAREEVQTALRPGYPPAR